VRAINSMLTVGRGQRMGLFAGSGVGKSVLLGMMARYTSADVIVVGLIGERGREVKEFIEQILGEEGLARAVVVAAPADTPPLMRLQGAAYATPRRVLAPGQERAVDRGFAHPLCDGAANAWHHEPPVIGLSASSFAKRRRWSSAPAMVTGWRQSPPSTVLTEGDDQQDPIADAARAILDGHIVLDRSLAESGHYPAINIEQSISRAMHSITTPEHQQLSRRLKKLYSRYERSRDLINVGAYAAGTDPLLDEAIRLQTGIEAFLQQNISEHSNVGQSLNELGSLVPITHQQTGTLNG
jgi:flagellum-specific ATP synthase